MAETIDPILWFRRASPYIYLHRQKTFVLCLDDQAMSSDNVSNVLRDITLLHSLGVRIILVHGSCALDDAASTDSKSTDSKRAPIEAWISEVGGETHQLIAELSANAHHSSPFYSDLVACTGNFIRAQPLGVMNGEDQGPLGKTRKVNTSAITALLDDDMLVIVPPIGYSLTGETFVLDCKALAGQVAEALSADKLIYFLPTHGIQDETSQRVSELPKAQAIASLSRSNAGMASGIDALLTSDLDAQSRRCHLVSHTHDGALLEELFTLTGSGTIITPGSALIRPATLDDVDAIRALVEPLEQSGALIPRSIHSIEQHLEDYLVLDLEGALIGCGALHAFEDTAEIAGLATHPGHRDQDYGERILGALLHKAAQKALRSVFVLTTQTEHWFLERGFMRSDQSALPLTKRATYDDRRNSKVLVRQL
ncbi:MAG: amino-acid N-acetyltransferase [Pseudomonadota bacterium]|nr:amino-acid N-acetyltransferase [Pseudomonadota bacterium]